MIKTDSKIKKYPIATIFEPSIKFEPFIIIKIDIEVKKIAK